MYKTNFVMTDRPPAAVQRW